MENEYFNTLGDICKEFESHGTNLKFAPRGVLMARLDGNCFHTFTKGLTRPFDGRLGSAMQNTMSHLAKTFHCSVGYTQSDEISLAWDLTKPKKPGTIFPYDGKAHKLNSILAGHASSVFNNIFKHPTSTSLAVFDCRTWGVPSVREAADTFLWRQLDAEKNSVNSVAGCYFSPPELHKVGVEDRLKMLKKKNVYWNNYPDHDKMGTFVLPKTVSSELTEEELLLIPERVRPEPGTKFKRTNWDKVSFRLSALAKDDLVKRLFK